MNIDEAQNLLGLDGSENLKEIKSKYRKLMHTVHPDSQGDDAASNNQAATINAAYHLIAQSYTDNISESRPAKSCWSGKENPNAFAERPIYHMVEGFDGENLGIIEIARGKYVWSLEEEFPLFLKSILAVSKELLETIDARLRREVSDDIKQNYLAELTYLLTSQFIDSTSTLEDLAAPDGDAYRISAMVELAPSFSTLAPGTSLFPAGVSKHRLYLRNKAGQLVGYLSFKDDRLYYVLIPLFELKRVQVKMLTRENALKSKTRQNYVDMDLWVKLINEDEKTALESVSLKIQDLLDQYGSSIRS